jgi:hypothetical protein
MPITESDIKILASQRMTDTPDGGGRMTSTVVQSGVDNNVFDDVSDLDRVYGNVSLRKVFVGVVTNDTDKYLGARLIIDQAPQDPTVHGLLFAASKPFDTRTEATVKVESYLAPGGFYQGLLYGNHLAGMSALMLIQQPSMALPTIGQRLLLRKNEGLVTEFDQYVRVTDVASVNQVFTDGSGDFVRTLVTCELSDPLREAFNGWQAERIDAGLNFTGKTRLYNTVVADASQYFGIRPLEDAAAIGDFTIRTDSVYSTLLPSSQVETPLADARSNNVSAAMVASGGRVSQAINLAFTTSQRLFIGGGIVPGSLQISGGGVALVDAGGVLKTGTTEVGAIDYENGIASLSQSVFGSTTALTVSYVPGARPDFVSKSVGIPISINNRSLSYVITLGVVPASASLSISYMTGGQWYTLREDGSGAIAGADTSLGAGTLNYTTSTVIVTVGALPDVGSAIVLQWAEQVFAPPANNVDLQNGGRLYFAFNAEGVVGETPAGKMLAPNSVSITWANSGTKTATDNGLGALTGDATGTVDYVRGIVRISPNLLPPAGTVFSLANSVATVASTPAPINVVGGSIGTVVKPYSVSFPLSITVTHSSDGQVANTNVTKTVQALDDGAGHIVFSDGANGNVQVGTVNYTTGALSLSSTVALGAIDSEGATVTTESSHVYTQYVSLTSS